MPLLLTHASALLTTACIAGLWQGAALALLATALLRLMPRASAALRHSLLVVLFAAAAVLPWIHLREVATGSDHSLRIAPWMGGVVAGIWLAAALGRAVQLFLAWRHLCAVRRNAEAINGFEAFAAGGRRAVLCVSPDVDAPMILGFHSPRLLLPEGMAQQLSSAELHHIALHECEHLRRRDDWMNLLLQVGLVLSPLNPALVWLNRRIGVQRELAVDAAVVAATAQPIAYAACLTRLAEQRMQQTHLRLALAAWERKSELVQRVHALLRQSTMWNRRQSAVATTVAGMALLAASTGIARVPQFVRVADVPMVIATNQPPATIVPMIDSATLAGVNRLGQAGGTVRMIPASFPVKPVATIHAKSKRKQPATTQKTQVDFQTIQAAPVTTLQPRMVRTAAVVPAHVNRETGLEQQDDLQVRFTTADFSTPYVAVPVQNGWLLIQL